MGESVIMVALPAIHTIAVYDGIAFGGLMPLFQQYFNKSDSGIATIKTTGDACTSITLIAMWLFGDFLPKK
ncbi:hypothetical protein PFISCL1PPCAC_22192 [Pristionchus fissidentatus]|uniref:Membrane transporter n=1 Tax=Pristionchus fissidentatus TaxID=1538716 RepID=A0AAV5WK12_9BILA|nr:hypothetical protein PFISCL1PPCAC_22192 [Pristionchus fissidentatus]